jgi:hypothetical protein
VSHPPAAVEVSLAPLAWPAARRSPTTVWNPREYESPLARRRWALVDVAVDETWNGTSAVSGDRGTRLRGVVESRWPPLTGLDVAEARQRCAG